jgi:hypothetical protein
VSRSREFQYKSVLSQAWILSWNNQLRKSIVLSWCFQRASSVALPWFRSFILTISYLFLIFSSFLPTYSDTHYRNRGLILYLITFKDSYFLRRTPLDEGSVPRRYLYLTIHNIHMTRTSINPAGFDTAIPASDRLQTLTVGRAATGIGDPLFTSHYHQPQIGTGWPNTIFSRSKLKSTARLQSRKHWMKISSCLHREGKRGP